MTRILAIDYGSKRIGLAVSDPLGFSALPMGFLPFKGQKRFIEELKKVIAEKEVKLIVLGLPINMDGTMGPKAEEMTQVSEVIKKECGLPVELVDERLTTQQAETMLVDEFDLGRKKRKAVRDSIAAAILLQSYLEKVKKDS